MRAGSGRVREGSTPWPQEVAALRQPGVEHFAPQSLEPRPVPCPETCSSLGRPTAVGHVKWVGKHRTGCNGVPRRPGEPKVLPGPPLHAGRAGTPVMARKMEPQQPGEHKHLPWPPLHAQPEWNEPRRADGGTAECVQSMAGCVMCVKANCVSSRGLSGAEPGKRRPRKGKGDPHRRKLR